MTVNVVVERSGLSVLAALREVSPAEADAFEAEYRAALVTASRSLDLAEAEQVLTHWWGVVHLRMQPLSGAERDLIRRLRSGEDVGWSSPHEYRTAKGV